MRKKIEEGFTLVELSIAVVIMSMITATVMPAFTLARYTSKEKEVKDNIHTIQMALARYANDRNGLYPKMIWGGDKRGWSTQKDYGCRTMWEHEPYNGKNEDTAHPPVDPLIAFNYLSHYPYNPFLNSGQGLETVVRWTGGPESKPGDGDPRFGYNGIIMGNILTDPMYLWKSPYQLSRIKNCFTDDAIENNIAMVNPELPGNPFYAMGGIPQWPTDPLDDNAGKHTPDRKTLSAYWPGEFFYRSRGNFIFPPEYLTIRTDIKDPGWDTIWEFKHSEIKAYLIGGFGHTLTEGMDIIRMTDLNGRTINNLTGCSENCYYTKHPKYKRTKSTPIHFSSPEIRGGGQWGQMPYYPPLDPENGSWIWGSADGFRDGVIFASTEKGNMILEWREKEGTVRVK
jgi:prepilin-type N-terminal cleavage/methylation domain-containing protein